MLNFKQSRWPVFVGLLLLIAICSYVPAGIIQAVIPQAVPTPNKRGNSTVFQLSSTNVAASTGSLLCQDVDGNATSSGCFVPPGQLTFYLSNTASDVATYLQATVAPFSPHTDLTFAALGNGTTTIQNWATVPGQPGITSIPAGAYSFHVHASKAAGATVSIQTQFWEVNAAGVDIALIGLSDSTGNLTTSEIQYDLEFANGNTYTLASSTSRIVARVQAVVASAPGTAHIFVGCTADSHISIPNPGGGGGSAGAPGATLFSSTTQAGPDDVNTETSLIGTVVGSQTIAANTFVNGQVLEARAQGYYSLPAAADALTIKAKCGSTVLGTITFTPGTGAITTNTFRLWLMVTAIGTGSGGALITNGGLETFGAGSLTQEATSQVGKMLNTSNVAFDFTTSCAFDITAQWGGAQVGELIKGTNASAWIPGAPVTSVNGMTGAVTVSGGFTPDILSEAKNGGTLNSAKVEGITIAASGTGTLLNVTPGSAGYVSAMFIAFDNSDANARSGSTLKITVDGETSGGTFNDRIPLFFGAEYCLNTVNYHSRWTGCQQNATNNIGFFSYIPIPFSTSVKVELVNGSLTTSSTVWAVFSYQTGVANTWPKTQHLRTSSGTLTNQTVNTVETLVNASSLNPGRLMGVYMSIDSFPNTANPPTAPLEGNVKMYIDGSVTPNLESSGTEDYFHWSNYFEGVGTLYGTTSGNFSYDQGYTGLQFSSVPGGAPQTWNAYRFHIMDQVLFTNALKITWNAGDSTQVNFTGGVRLAYNVWYYTQ